VSAALFAFRCFGIAAPARAFKISNFKPQASIRPIAKPVHDSFSTDDLIERLRSIDWFQFEKVVALMYEGQGYIVDRRGGANPDGGIDMVIKRNGARRAVQCKQWKSWKLPEKTVREFVGAMHIAGITQGVFVILSGCTEPARQLAQEREIEIVDEDVLARMLEAAGAPYDPAVRALLDDERKYCPKCESEMVLRTTRKGPNAGGQFWGCSTYPRCNFMMPGP
jgi:restriction system protein